MKSIESNIKSNCCQKKLPIAPALTRSIRLFDKINDACLQNLNFKWYDLNKIRILNDNQERPTGIVCHKCTNGNCVLSIKINKKHTRFCNINSIAFK